MEPMAFSIEQVQKLSGLGRTKLYEILRAGALPAKKLGKRTLILRSDLEAFLGDLKPYTPQQDA